LQFEAKFLDDDKMQDKDCCWAWVASKNDDGKILKMKSRIVQ
jgi:hypothetical protein